MLGYMACGTRAAVSEHQNEEHMCSLPVPLKKNEFCVYGLWGDLRSHKYEALSRCVLLVLRSEMACSPVMSCGADIPVLQNATLTHHEVCPAPAFKLNENLPTLCAARFPLDYKIPAPIRMSCGTMFLSQNDGRGCECAALGVVLRT